MEYYSKCNVCGKIICYTDKDLKDNAKNSLIAGLAAMSSIGNAVAGTRYDMYESGKLSSRASDKVVDYSKCSNCGSKDVTLVTKKFAIFSNRNNGNYSVKDLLSEAKKYLEKKDYEDAFCFATMILNDLTVIHPSMDKVKEHLKSEYNLEVIDEDILKLKEL